MLEVNENPTSFLKEIKLTVRPHMERRKNVLNNKAYYKAEWLSLGRRLIININDDNKDDMMELYKDI